MANLKTSLLVTGAVALLALVFWWAPPGFLKREPVKVQYQVATGGTNELRAQVIKKYGIDIKNGVDLEIISTDPGELERRIINKESYLAEVSPFSVFAAQQKNTALRIISPAVLYKYHLLVSNDSRITSLDDLKGKRISTQPKATAAYSALAIVLKSAGFDIEKDFKVTFGNIPQTAAAVEKGEADTAAASYPSVALLVAGGKFKSAVALGDVWGRNNEGLSLPFVVLVANGDWFDKNKDTAKRVVKTILDGGRFIQERPQAIAEITDYLTKNNYNSTQVITLLEENIPGMLPSSFGEREMKSFEKFFAQAKQLKFIPQDFPIENYIVKPSELGL